MPDETKTPIADNFGKYIESYAVIQTGSVNDEGEITKFPSPVVISVWPTREKANSMKKRQATRVARIHKWFASDDAIATPLLAVRIVMIRKPAARKPKVTELTPEQLSLPPIPVDEHTKALEPKSVPVIGPADKGNARRK